MKRRHRALLVVAIVAWLMLCGETAPADRQSEAGAHAWDGGALDWQVLAPRHRITSPAPLIVFVTPGWLGPVQVRIETPRGVETVVTRARGLAWPDRLHPLSVGEWCAVTVTGPHGRSAESACLRAPTPPADAGRAFLSLGFPSAACLEGGQDLGVALLRSGLERLPAPSPSATMTRDREWR